MKFKTNPNHEELDLNLTPLFFACFIVAHAQGWLTISWWYILLGLLV